MITLGSRISRIVASKYAIMRQLAEVGFFMIDSFVAARAGRISQFQNLFLIVLFTFPLFSFAAEPKSPLTRDEASLLLGPIDKGLKEFKAREKEEVALPGKVRDKVEALQLVAKQIEGYAKKQEAPKGILIWFKDRIELTKEDGKYIADLTTLCALYVEHLLRLYAKAPVQADEKLLGVVKGKTELLGQKFSDEELKEIAASIRMMDDFRAKAKKRDKSSLSPLGVLLRERCDAIAGITEEEWENGLEELSVTGKVIRSVRCRIYLEPVFEKFQGKPVTALP
jgi:hypothetical protein